MVCQQALHVSLDPRRCSFSHAGRDHGGGTAGSEHVAIENKLPHR